MPIIRNPFRKTPADQYVEDGIFPVAPDLIRSDTTSTFSKPLSIRSNSRSNSHEEPREYQLSEISDSGVFIPPSPPETKSFWSSRSGTSTRSSSHRSVLNENEPFNISRESFDSYRRSFDISARSPVIEPSSLRGRQSLDARQMRLSSTQSLNSPPKHVPADPSLGGAAATQAPNLPPVRPSISPYITKPLVTLTDRHYNPPTVEPEESEDASPSALEEKRDRAATTPTKVGESLPEVTESFEEVGLADDSVSSKPKRRPQERPSGQQFSGLHNSAARRSGIFARFTNSSSADASAATGNHSDGANNRPASSGLALGSGSSGHHFFGRKRGASGQGAELGSMHGKRSSIVSAIPSHEVKTDA